MHYSNSLPSDIPRILKSIPQYLFTRCFGDEFDRLHDTGDDDMFDSAILALGVFTDENCVDATVGSLVPLNRTTGTDICKERECTTQSQVEGDMAFANRCSEGSFECDGVLFDYCQLVIEIYRTQLRRLGLLSCRLLEWALRRRVPIRWESIGQG